MAKKQIDQRAETMWDKSSERFKNYQDYIDKKKPDRHTLELIDLLYISNFKSGNATIGGTEKEVNSNLIPYSEVLRDIASAFTNRKLADLTEKERKSLYKKIDNICILTDKGCETKIDGFSSSYLSALLSAYFPDLIPILDRRVLINLKIISKADRDSQDQIINSSKFFIPLMDRMAMLSKDIGKSLRDIDREEFIKKIPDKGKRSKKK